MGLQWTITPARHFHSSSLYYFYRPNKRMNWGGLQGGGELVLQHPSASSKSARQLLTLGWTASSKKLLRKVIILWWWWWGGAQINSSRRDRVIGGPSNRVPPNEPRCEGREVPALLPQVIYPSFFQSWGVTHSLQPLGHPAQHF